MFPGSAITESGFNELKQLLAPTRRGMRPKLAEAYMVGSSMLKVKRKMADLTKVQREKHIAKKPKLEKNK